jgi:flotillin
VIDAEGRAQGQRVQAEGEAAATQTRAQAQAEAIKMTGLAEAESLKAKGLAEAEALRRRVDVLNVQNQAAILDKALSGLPDIAGKLFEAYGKIGSVTYVASGDGDGVTSRIAKDVVGMVPMLGAMFESVTGMKLRDLIAARTGNGSTPEVESGEAPATVPIIPVTAAAVSPSGDGSAEAESESEPESREA